MRDIFIAVCENFEAELVEFDGEREHVHLLVNYPPKGCQVGCCEKSLMQYTHSTGKGGFGRQVILPGAVAVRLLIS